MANEAINRAIADELVRSQQLVHSQPLLIAQSFAPSLLLRAEGFMHIYLGCSCQVLLYMMYSVCIRERVR